ncbi:MAG: glycosyltransferase, partial [Limnobacter sp.]|nr:glycosyltransferase [Limnobacter sp.]
GNAPSDITLAQWIERIPVLDKLAKEGRLKWYNLRTTKTVHGSSPVVQAMAFSSEAAVSALGLAGVKTIRTLGVDGGTDYAVSFDDLAGSTRLNNGHKSYDIQFQGIANTVQKHQLDFGPLNAQIPVKVFVGSQEEQMLAVKVLEYTIQKHSSISVEVLPLHGFDVQYPMPQSPENKPRTPFSFQRFSIPKLAGYEGRAIYVDSDMMVFKDIAKLWLSPMNGNNLLSAGLSEGGNRIPQYSVMLLDCSRLDWSPEKVVGLLDEGKLSYAELMYEMKIEPKQEASISENWNSLENYVEGQTALLHYTDMNKQPWLSRKNKFGHIWVRALIDAIEDGYINIDMVVEHVQKGWIRPSLLRQVKSKRPKILRYSPIAMFLDRNFVPPHKKSVN